MPNSSGEKGRGSNFGRENVYLRARLIDIFLLIIASIVIIVIVSTLFSQSPDRPLSNGQITNIYASSIFFLLGIFVVYVLKRWLSIDSAAICLLSILIVAIVLSDDPHNIAEGRALVFFTVPIVFASVVFRPWGSFVFAGLSALVVSITDIFLLHKSLNINAIIVFFILALGAWLYARARDNALRSLFQLNEKTQKVDEEIRNLTKFPNENPNPVMRINNDGRLVFANQASQIILNDWQGQVGEMIAEKWKDIAAECLSTNNQTSMDINIGEKVYSLFFVPIIESNYVNLYGKDITKRIQSEKASRESEQRYHQLFDTMLDGFALHEIVCDDQGKPIDYRFLEVNSAFEEMTGLLSDEIIGKTVLQVMPGVEPEWIEIYGNVALTGKSIRFENYSQPIGKHFEVMAYSPRENQFATIFTDITNRKETENALHRAMDRERRLAEILDHASVPFAIGYSNGFIEAFNSAFNEMLGYSPEEFQKMSWIEDITPPEWRKFENDQLEKMNITGQPVRYEKEVLRKNGSRVPVELLVHMINDDKGKPEYYYGFITDLTERKKAEEEIRKLNLELEQRVIDRTEQLNNTLKELESFAYSVSHDLRAPLRAIDGFSQALSNEYSPVLSGDGLHYLERVRAGVKRMDQLISDMLKLSRVTRQQINFEQVDLSKIANNISEELMKNQPERDVQWEISDGMKTFGDVNLLKLAIVNLLSNALKFTGTRETARIEFSCLQENGRNIYYVRDNGVGFNMDYADKLFGAFQRLHSANDFPGNGIGLATVQRIIHRHGGKIWAESAVDQGAVFYFNLDETNIG